MQKPVYLLHKGGKAVHETNRIKFENKPDSITLKCKSAEPTDAGKYNLTLTNEKGSDNVTMNVIVVGKQMCYIHAVLCYR